MYNSYWAIIGDCCIYFKFKLPSEIIPWISEISEICKQIWTSTLYVKLLEYSDN